MAVSIIKPASDATIAAVPLRYIYNYIHIPNLPCMYKLQYISMMNNGLSFNVNHQCITYIHIELIRIYRQLITKCHVFKKKIDFYPIILKVTYIMNYDWLIVKKLHYINGAQKFKLIVICRLVILFCFSLLSTPQTIAKLSLHVGAFIMPVIYFIFYISVDKKVWQFQCQFPKPKYIFQLTKLPFSKFHLVYFVKVCLTDWSDKAF